jgi:1-acyl-sn-glycerol-3-phosphate acyltransferase
MFGWLCYGFLYSILRGLVLLRIFRWKVEGLENLPPRQAGGMIIAMNHVHWMDIPVIGGMLPLSYQLSWLGKSELFKNPIIGWWFRQMKVIAINRGKRDLAALETSVQALRDGAVLLIYPEGHRSRDGVLLPGRGGAVRMAMQSGMPIVPVAVLGTEQGLKGSLTGKPVTLRIGAPFVVPPTADGKIPPDTMDQLTTEMMQRIAVMLPPDRRGPYAQLTS